MSPRTLVTFREGVSCRREPEGPLGLTLFGRTRDQPDERASVAFTGSAPEGLPEALEDAAVEQVDATTSRIVCVGREWLVCATAAHVHREVATAFDRVVKPRRPSWSAAAPAAVAEPLVLAFVEALRGRGATVHTGRFRTRMHVASVNVGPRTVILDSAGT